MTIKKRTPKVKPIKTIEIEEAVARKFGIRTNLIVPNISWGIGIHECDLFIVKLSGYCVEVEIKISKNDLLSDFKKKHQHKDRRIKEFYYAFPETMLKTCEELIPKEAGIITCRRYGNGVFATFHRIAPSRLGALKLSKEEQFKIARLGTLRIWSLKKKLIKLQNK